MYEPLRQQVVLLEETCHKALQERENTLVRLALIEALLVFYVDAPDEAPPVIKGLCNIARVRADFLLSSCKENDELGVHWNLVRMCFQPIYGARRPQHYPFHSCVKCWRTRCRTSNAAGSLGPIQA